MSDPPDKHPATPVHTATIRFYEELNDFLPPEDRKRDLQAEIPPSATVADLIRSMGVPTEQVDLVLVNGRPEHFHCPVRQGDRVSVFPVFESLDISSLTRLPGRPLRKPRFIAEAGLEKLAAALRSQGFDVTLHSSRSGQESAGDSLEPGRILLTTRADIFQKKGVTHAVVVAGDRVEEQLASVMTRLDVRKQDPGP